MKYFKISLILLFLVNGFCLIGQTLSTSITFDHPSEITTSRVVDNSIVIGYYGDGLWGLKSYNILSFEEEFDFSFTAGNWSSVGYIFAKDDGLFAILVDGAICEINRMTGNKTVIDSLEYPLAGRNTMLHFYENSHQIKVIGTSSSGSISFPTNRWNMSYTIEKEDLSISSRELPESMDIWNISTLKLNDDSITNVLYKIREGDHFRSELKTYDDDFSELSNISIEGEYVDFIDDNGGFILSGKRDNRSVISRVDEQGTVTSIYELNNQGYGKFYKLLTEENYLYAFLNTTPPNSGYWNDLILYKIDLNDNRLIWSYLMETNYEIDFYPGIRVDNVFSISRNEILITGVNFTDVSTDSRGFINWLNTDLVNIEELNKETICLVYPNPASSIITIKEVPSKSSVIIYNIDGTMIKSAISDNGKIDVTDLNRGIYYLSFSIDGKYYSSEFIKL